MHYAVQPPPAPRPPERRAKVADLIPQLDKLFSDHVTRHHYPGLGVGIVLDGELVYARGFGFRDLSTRTPFDANTVFRIASVTKSFAAMAILKLRDEGKLSLDVPAAQYYPPLANLVYPTRDSPPVTVRQLLTHGSGLPEDNYWVDVAIDMTDAELLALVQSGMSFSHAPDTHFEYSNVGYALIGKVIESVSGMPAREYVRREILAPLGMSASAWEAEEVPRDHLAIGYRGDDGYRGKDLQQLPAPILKTGVFDVVGGLYTTVRDMGRYMVFQLSVWPPGDAPETGPVRRSTVREMQQGPRRGTWSDFLGVVLSGKPQPVVLANDQRFRLSAFSYGGGLVDVTTCADAFLLEHSGGLPGYSTYLTLLPEAGYGVVLFINDERVSSRPDIEATELFRKAGLLGKPEVTAVPALLDARATVGRLLGAWDADAAKQLFEPTFFSYQSVDKLAEQFAKLAKDHGACQPDGGFEAVNWLRGRWRLRCERGEIIFAAALSPRANPLLQELIWESDLPPTPRMSKAAAALVQLMGRWDDPAARALFAPPVDRARAKTALARLGLDHGKCTVEQALKGDGANTALFQVNCTEGPLHLKIDLDEKTGLVTEWRGFPPRGPDSPNCAR
jgi:CubicO group peptidase (beta-lactamase class C family)